MLLAIVTTALRKKIPERLHINWLNFMLWGGVAGLAVEHIAHQEIVFYPPFLTAMKSASDTSAMFHEMATIGTAMLIGIVAIWSVMVIISNLKPSERTVKSEG